MSSVKTGYGKPFFRGLFEQMKGHAMGMAGAADADELEKLTPDEKLMLWNRRAMPIEKEWELHREVNPDGTPRYTPEDIGLMVFPDRERLAKSGGRIEPKEFAREANRLAKRAAERRALEAPPPEPLMPAMPMPPNGAASSFEEGY